MTLIVRRGAMRFFRDACVNPSNLDRPCEVSLRRAVTSASEPVSRILSCAVIPLGAALPRTLISDLPGGFGTCSNRLSRTGPIRLAARFYRHWRVPPYLVLLRVGFTLPA